MSEEPYWTEAEGFFTRGQLEAAFKQLTDPQERAKLMEEQARNDIWTVNALKALEGETE